MRVVPFLSCRFKRQILFFKMTKLAEEMKLCVMLNKNNLSHYTIIIFY